MLILWRRAVAAVLLSTAGVGLIYFGASTFYRRGQDFGGQTVLQYQLDDGDLTSEEIEHRRLTYLQRSEAKERAIVELRAGHITLLEAAARFRDADMAIPIAWGGVRHACHGPAEGEHYCRAVMSWEQCRLIENSPKHVAEVAARREAELQQHRNRDGIVRLPE